MKKYKGYRVEMYPTDAQKEQLMQYCYASRYAYNWGLYKYKEIYEATGHTTSSNDLCQMFTKFKNGTDDVCKWLKTFKATCLRISVRNVSKMFVKYFKRLANHPSGKIGAPEPITKKSGKNFFFTRKERMFIYDRYISFEGFTTRDNNMILLKNHNIPHDKEYNYCDPHISCDKSGRWWFSCQIEQEEPETDYVKYNEPIGIDLGVKTFVTLSDGTKYDYPRDRINKLEKRKKRKQRRLSKIYKQISQTKTKSDGAVAMAAKSSNTLKKEKSLQKVEDRIANIRRNTRYQIAKEIINKRPRAIVMEGLNVTGMMKNHRLSTKIQRNGFYYMRSILEYKSSWEGIDFILADNWFPSSKKCSRCGSIKKDLRLKDRVYVCPACGLVIDRDINAAINLKNLASVVG